MTSLIRFPELPLTRVLGWSLLHFVWEGAIVGVLLVCVLGLLRSSSPQLRYIVACSALLLMFTLPLITFWYLATTIHVPNHTINTSMGMISSLRYDFSSTAGSWLDRIYLSVNGWLPWVIAAWSSGVLIFLGRLNIALIVAWRLKSIAIQTAPAELQLAFRNLICRFGITRQVRLTNSAMVQVPTVSRRHDSSLRLRSKRVYCEL